MGVNIEEFLPPDIVETYKANARSRGMSLDEFVRDYLVENAPPLPSIRPKILDDSFDGFPDLGPVFEEGLERVTWFC